MKLKLNKPSTIKPKYWIILFSVLLIVVAVAISIQAVSAPSHGKITTSADSKLKLAAPRQKQSATPSSDIQNSYFKLTLPAGYRQQSSSADTPGLLYQQTIIKGSTSGSLIVAISIASLGSGLSENTAYNLRVHNSGRYKMTNQTIQGEPVIIFNDAQTAAVAAFWVHGSLLATVSVSSGLQNPAADDNAEEIKALRPLLEAWQWQ